MVLYSAFGDCATSSPYTLGRTCTHEVGHYLGLEHTFSGGCANASNCYQNGDLICDTNPEADAIYDCVDLSSCGSADPIHNFMDCAPGALDLASIESSLPLPSEGTASRLSGRTPSPRAI